MSTSMMFPKTLAALQAYENHQWMDQWAIGDALIEECGPPGAVGVHTGSSVRLLQAVTFIKANGKDYAERTLRQFRDISHLYPVGERLPTVGWSVHAVVPGPEWLNRILEGLPKGETLTAEKASTMVKLLQEENFKKADAEREAAYHAAQEEEKQAAAREKKAAEEARNAASEEARRIAEKKQAEANSARKNAQTKKRNNQKLPPRREVDETTPVPAAEKIPSLALSMTLSQKASQATKLGEDALEIIGIRGGDLSEVEVDAIIEAGLEAHDSWLKVVNALRKSHGNRRGHLSVVGENND